MTDEGHMFYNKVGLKIGFKVNKPIIFCIAKQWIFVHIPCYNHAKTTKKGRDILSPEYRVVELHQHKDCAYFTQQGMEGIQRKNPDRPVSLISLAARQAVDEAVLRGLCYKKFSADITLACEKMPETNDILCVGELKLGILPERKRCWPECVLLEKKLPCPLIEGVRYAWVEVPGRLCMGDRFQIIKM